MGGGKVCVHYGSAVITAAIIVMFIQACLRQFWCSLIRKVFYVHIVAFLVRKKWKNRINC